jgi:hypothetical protein
MYYHYFIFRFGYYSGRSQQRSTAEMNECINEYVSAWLASPPLLPLLPPLHPVPLPSLDSLSSAISVPVNAWRHQHTATRSDPQHTFRIIRPTEDENMYEIRKKFEILNAKGVCLCPSLQSCADIYNKHAVV